MALQFSFSICRGESKKFIGTYTGLGYPDRVTSIKETENSVRTIYPLAMTVTDRFGIPQSRRGFYDRPYPPQDGGNIYFSFAGTDHALPATYKITHNAGVLVEGTISPCSEDPPDTGGPLPPGPKPPGSPGTGDDGNDQLPKLPSVPLDPCLPPQPQVEPPVVPSPCNDAGTPGGSPPAPPGFGSSS